MTRRALPALVAVCLLICPVGGSLAAPPPQDNGQAAPGSWQISPELLAQGAAWWRRPWPERAPWPGHSSTTVGPGSRWTTRYFRHRGGFVGGVATGICVFGLLGYPIDGGASWLAWAAHQVTILGIGLIGAWAADLWYQAPAR